jgi:hypothetical protein
VRAALFFGCTLAPAVLRARREDEEPLRVCPFVTEAKTASDNNSAMTVELF